MITIQFKFSFLIGLFANSRRKILDYRTGDLNANLLKRRFYNCLMLFDSFFFQYNSVISNGLRKQLGIKQKGTLILPLGADVISQTKHTYEKLHLLYVGSLNRRNIYQTIEGLALFIKSNPDFRNIIKYTIIGFGSEIEVLQIKNTILKNDLRGTVEYLGRKKYTELPYYFSMCNIGISYVPITSFYEHQPVTKTFEYALSGLFCIATDTYENRAVITPKNGLLCNDNPESFATSLQQVFDIRNTLDEEGIRNSLKEYHWRKIVKEKLEPFLR